jgi:U3 small nucleolar RNA-associated protein 22
MDNREFLNNQELFKSNLIQCQINELLIENNKKNDKIIDVLSDLKLTSLGSIDLGCFVLSKHNIIDAFDPNMSMQSNVSMTDSGNDSMFVDGTGIVNQNSMVKYHGLDCVLLKNQGFTIRLFNNSLLIKWNQELKQILNKVKDARNALVLIKIWARKRNLLNGFILTCLLCHLVDSKIVKKQFNSWQIFKLFIDFISKLKQENALNLLNSVSEDQDYGFSCFDTNITKFITKSNIQLLIYEANQTLKMINGSDDFFENVFLLDSLIHLKYDNIYKVPIQADVELINKMFTVLKNALSDRVDLINIYFDGEIIIGIILDTENCLRQVEKNTNNSLDFKILWGQKAELRRFQDGSIVESVVFENNGSLHQKSLIVARMVAFLLHRHFNIESSNIVYWAGLGNKYLKELHNNEISFQPLLDQYTKLCRKLRDLNLPLSINTFHIKSDSLVQCSVIIPEPIGENEFKSRSNPSEFLIEFEFSAKWPDDINAIETMKRAFYIKIVQELENEEYTAKVCLDENNLSFIDITDEKGYLFRAWIINKRVDYLLEQAIKKCNVPVQKHLLYEHQRNHLAHYSRIPVHYALLNALIHRFTFLGNTIRLAKRWASCHLSLANGIHGTGLSPYVIELLCVKIYTDPNIYSVPCSGWTGFVRFLHQLCTHPWTEEPMVIELEQGKMTPEIRSEIQSNFTKIHQGGTNHISLFVATELDPLGEWWNTTSQVPKKVFERIIVLANTSIQYIKQQLLKTSKNDISV